MKMTMQQLTTFHKALSDETRISIILFLCEKSRCVCICELADYLKKNQSVIYKHIQLLQDAHIVSTHKQGKYLMCCVKDAKQTKKLLEVPNMGLFKNIVEKVDKKMKKASEKKSCCSCNEKQ